MHKFPEVDRGEWHRYEDAKRMLGINQQCFLETARKLLD
jgi:predicted NUDIX family NTP pyrophosphohydrolase